MSFKINENYAKRYNEWRQREEKQKLKAKYGDDALDDEDSDASSSETEDEDAEELTTQMEKGWLKTMAALKGRDPAIFNSKKRFYESSDDDEEEPEKQTKKKKKKKDKAMFLKDYEREVMTKKDGKFDDDDEDEEDEREEEKNMPLSYYEEQAELKKGFKDVVHDSDTEDDLLVARKKSKSEKEADQEDYRLWLKEAEGNANDTFLWDFIGNKRFASNDDEDVPTYAEIVNEQEEDLSEQEEILHKQETFEHKFNFRHEEPDPEFMKRYPRLIGDSLRPKDTKRKEQRKTLIEKKKREKAKKKEGIKALKNIKKKEIMKKIEQLKEATGNKELAFKEADLQDDFDPDKHDQMMQRAFDEDFYEGMEEDDDEKPVFSDGELNYDEEGVDGAAVGEGGHEDFEPHCEDPDFNMDADYDPSAQASTSAQPSTSFSRKKEKKLFKDAMSKKKPVFDPSEKTFEEYLDEYYKLDFEDIIDDIPCRFKYRTVAPNDFGLSTEEILSAKPAELNKWVSVKKMSQYRTEEEEKYDRLKFQKMSKKGVKYNVMPSLRSKDEEPAEKSKDKKKKWMRSKEDKKYSIPEDRFKAYGIEPQKYRAKKVKK